MNTTLPTLHLGRGTRRGALTVFPIWQASPAESPARLADGDSLIVEELNDEVVERLQITATNGRKPVLIPDGDLLIGGFQNRVAIGSTLVAAGDSAVIDVRCVEPERWDGNRLHCAGTHRASTRLRGLIDQHEVWDRVAIERRQHATPPRVDDLAPLPGQSGVLVGIGGRPVLLEVFAHPDLLTAAWRRIVTAAARDAAGRPEVGTPTYRARRFMNAVDHIQPVPTEPGGSARRLAARLETLELQALSDGMHLLHMSVLDRQAVAA